MRQTREMTRLRDESLMRDYRRNLMRAMRSDGPIDRGEVIRRTLTESRPRYYLNFDQSYYVMCRLHNKGITGRRLTLKQQMWREIYSKTIAEAEANGISLSAALARVLSAGRASRYFISEQYAAKHITDVQRRMRQQALQCKRANGLSRA